MMLETIPRNASVFIDANIFIYHFADQSESCSEFIRRIEMKDLKGIISTHVIAEIIHRMMMLEALQKRLITAGSPTQKIRKKRNIIDKLNIFSSQGRQLLTLPLEILPLTTDLLREGILAAAKYHLLFNDALITAAMKENNISYLASADQDFITVPWIKLCSPFVSPRFN